MNSTTTRNVSTSTSHTSHSVKTTTFSIAVTANTTAMTAGTAMPTMSAPRFRRGYQQMNRAAWSAIWWRKSSRSESTRTSWATRKRRSGRCTSSPLMMSERSISRANIRIRFEKYGLRASPIARKIAKKIPRCAISDTHSRP